MESEDFSKINKTITAARLLKTEMQSMMVLIDLTN